MAKKYLPDLRFIPDGLTTVNSSTQLADGVTLGTFLNGITLDHIPELADRIQLARNLMPHAHIIKSIRENDKQFAKYKMVVVEGVYKPSSQEQLTESDTNHNFLATKGRGIVYELRRDGVTDNDKTFELAKYLQVYHGYYDKIILDFDTYNQGELNAQIIIQTPDIPNTYTVNFKREVESRFNNVPQASNQLVEITEIPSTAIVIPAPLPDGVSGFFTIGDLHSRLLRVFGGDPWQSFAVDGRTSRDNIVKENLRKIKSGNVVVISLGFNDMVTTTDTPTAIADRVLSAVNLSRSLGHVVSYMLFPITSKADPQRQEAVRTAIVSKLSAIANLNIIDLNNPAYTLSGDGQSLIRESYISVSDSLL